VLKTAAEKEKDADAIVVRDLAKIFGISEEEVRIRTSGEEEASALPGKKDLVTEADSIKDADLLKGRVLAVCQHCDFINDVTPHGNEVLAIENDDGPYPRWSLVMYDSRSKLQVRKPLAVVLRCSHCGNLLHKGGVVSYDLNPIVVRSEIPSVAPHEIEPYD